MFALSMVASLAGTPLRIAEAAHDIGCALADLDDAGAIEIPDGGVGDDSGVTTKGEAADPLDFGDDHAPSQPRVIDSTYDRQSRSHAPLSAPPSLWPRERLNWLQRYRC